MANYDPAIFAEPNRFAPERWEGEHGKLLYPHMVTYSEGSRRCIGRRYVPHPYHQSGVYGAFATTQ